MEYLKCVGVMFLVSGIIASIKYAFSEKDRGNDPVFEFIVSTSIWLLGGLCLYLLLKLFGIEI